MLKTLELAQALISKPSVTPQDSGCQQLIAERLKQSGFICESMRFDDVDNLWARFGKNTPLLVFAGHTDVVPPGPEADWITPPFSPNIRNGYLYGRGAADMKTGIAAMIVAAENFIRNHPHFNGSIAFLITSDEEGPSLNGTKKVIETLLARGEKIDYCIVGEASSEKIIVDQIRIGRRGSLHGKLTVYGKQGHIAYPDRALNPIHACILALDELAKTEWCRGNDHFPSTTFQISNIHGGTGASNVIPGHIEILFNFRFSTAVTVEQLKQRTENILKAHGLQFDINWSIGAEPFLTQHGKLIAAAQKAIKAVSSIETKLSTGGGTSDGRFIAPTGAEVIELGVCNESVHQVNERVKITDLDTLTICYEQILEHLFIQS